MWNSDWPLSKQKQWDAVITDYEKVIALVSSVATPQEKPGTGLFTKELALADYNKAAEVSKNPASAQKMREIVTLIEEWGKVIDK